MLDGRILGLDLGSSYGSGSLKALQNDNLPEIDLLVRESIQNSSDASLREPGDFFGVNFNFRKFAPKSFNNLLSDVSGILNERFDSNEADYLEIRDFKTSGLTGEVRPSEVAMSPDDHGNYFKLVFDTGKEQTNSDDGMAGGSWGYGKSVYFRFGIGLVVFYSHIRTETGFESRLIISLIENENDPNAILKNVRLDSIGRAWWGKTEAGSKDLLPITDETEIRQVLDVFGVASFGETETGTSIIIPYIDTNKLIEGIFPDNCGISDDVIAMCSFKDNIVEYTRLAIQKWYAPKIFNKNLSKYSNQKWLAVRVNDIPIRYQDMRPLFKLVQELYTSALSANKCGVQDYKSSDFTDIRSIAVPSQKVQNGRAGFVSTVVVKSSDFGSTGSIIPPQAYLRLFGTLTKNDPITMFARAAGMVLDYKIDGKWIKGITRPENEDEMLFSFFVPDCQLKLKDDTSLKQFSGMSLGNYLRKCEKSDHMNWTDPASLTVVTNISARVVSKVNECYKPKTSTEVEGAASRLSGRLGRKLLPKVNYGKKKGGSGSGGEGSGGSISNLDCKISQDRITSNSMVLNFEIKFMNNRKEAFLGVFVESEVGLVDADAWNKGIGTHFPISISEITNCEVLALNSKQKLVFENSCDDANPVIENDFTQICIVSSNKTTGFRIKNNITNAVISGVIVLTCTDRKYCCTIKETKEDIHG